ncbi:GspH/FimT family pseudopilin [Pseudomonas nicosulfuronedens]|uniref:GspH/FimT family pseudopilin n=1 Tax=Pseudomonas nicosulfuronedens TaxID=2571105 RepID=UPI002446BBC7|nr:GspH/FimT family pseudopilin [Pseudomonas nicosulfuronedens]MDH1011381.1 GspH/FimT family pseudopilin [Pseudomonas nicosulfuronedens]MDH1982156.1 GspH/FimT family pseudopilin [Pseudomonas nicosulfuronedens]MDH2030745.1 GspH/FimT family pseudopilin [Pseudomonas nicosulfuronedens]
MVLHAVGCSFSRLTLRRGRGRQEGFSLVELMVVVALLAIFAGVALPGFRYLIESSRVQSASSTLYRLLQASRADAVNTRQTLTLCPSSGNLQWVVVRASTCGSITTAVVSQRLELPSSLSVSSSISNLSFKPDGSAAAADLGISSSGTSKAFSIKVAASGYISLQGTSGQ